MVYRPKAFGGLGILNTKFMNITLMLKWVWKLYQRGDGLWADLIRANYLGDRDLFAGDVPTKGSQFWNSLQKIKWYFKLGARHKVRNGKITYFWSDWWIGNAPIQDRFPLLYSYCLNPHIMVSGVHSPAGWRIGFRRQLGLAEKV
jgi:hypothetical protein